MSVHTAPAPDNTGAPAHAPRPPDLPAHIDPADAAWVERHRRWQALARSPIFSDLHDALMLARQLHKLLEDIDRRYEYGEAGRILDAAGFDPKSPAAVSWSADFFDDALEDVRGFLWVLSQFVCILGGELPGTDDEADDAVQWKEVPNVG